ncbi:MAG: cytochrome d ubiquinol oxidase subunit II [Xanthomonadales bacterium]|nr:cytochrome d ubiquinol oxidase subunit II [Xanthomonadales bacterium]
MDFLDLPLIWAGLLALAVMLYVLLDGFDLGIGILFPFVEKDEQRNVMMNTVAPVWDGNETWLVLGGAGLFAAFPRAYAALMPAIYMPIGFMLTALIFRGVAFEFRFRAEGSARRLWDQAFHWGSVAATFAQGLILGALVQGIPLEDGRFAGGMFDWLTPFSFVTGCALLWGYALLGASWLIVKTEGELEAWCRRSAVIAAVVVVVMIAVVSVWVPALAAPPAQRWGLNYPDVDWSRLLVFSPVPILVALAFWRLLRGIRDGAVYRPYFWSVALFVMGYIGLLIGFYPYLIPYSLTIREAAAAPNAQALLLAGAAVMLPVILGYTGYVYWVFRGKVSSASGYH